MLEYPHKFRLALRFGGDGDESALCASASPSDSDKLLLYALAKQAECGSCNTPRPSFWDASIDKAKWDAWAEVGHRSKMEAMYLYVSAVEALAPEWWRWPPLGLVEAEAGSPTDHTRVGTSTPQGLKIRDVSESGSKNSNAKNSDSPSTPQGFKIKRVEEAGTASLPSLLLPPASPPSTSSLPTPAAPPTASHATPARVALGGWTALSVEGAPARYRHGCAVVGARLFVWGGRTNSGRLADGLYRLDLLSGRWNEIEISTEQVDISTKGNSTNQPPELRWGHSMNTYRQWIVIFGGHANRRCLNDVAMLDTEANTWFRPSPSGDLPPPRGSHASCVVSERLWAFGGDWASGGDAKPPLPQHAWSLPLRAAAAGDDCAWTLAQVFYLNDYDSPTPMSPICQGSFLPYVTYLIRKKRKQSKRNHVFPSLAKCRTPTPAMCPKWNSDEKKKHAPPLLLLSQASGTPPAPGYDHTAAVCAQSVLLLGGSSASGYVSLAPFLPYVRGRFSHMSGVVSPTCHRLNSKQAKKKDM